MAIQIVMDRTGDTRHEFDVSDSEAVARAEERFQQLTGKGFRAVALTGEPLAGFSDGTAFLRSPDNTFILFPSGRLHIDGRRPGPVRPAVIRAGP